MGTEEQWDEKFMDSVVENPFDDNVGWNGGYLETYGEELKHVQSVAMKTPKKVWTIIDGDEGDYIVTGYHHVNAYGYIITEKEWENETEQYKLESI